MTWHAALLEAQCISVVLSGDCYSDVRYGSKHRELHFSPGTFFSMPPGMHWDTLVATGSVTAITISMDQEILEFRPDAILQTPWFKDAAIFELVRTMSHTIPSGDILCVEDLSQTLLARLELLRSTNRQPGRLFPRPVLSARRQRVLLDVLNARLDERLSIRFLSALVALSPTQFSLAFQATFGRSVHQFILGARLQRAIELLKADNDALAQVSSCCGFSSQSHMTTAFRKAFGVTPQRYRENVRLHGSTHANLPAKLR